jgi:NADPH-dependent 2,4-dienoyl-CoA reductase/sulfur reductase-like enzyme
MGGATVAKYLRLWGGSNVQVTLIEREAAYQSNILSNLVLNGQTTMNKLTFSYNKLKTKYGINVVKGEVSHIDKQNRSVELLGGGRLSYDRLVMSPGIEFDLVPGLETAAAQMAVTHAWKAGPQTTVLAEQIRTMRRGGVFVMSIPKAPYRCPPGPYERACVVADYLKKTNPGSKVIVLDENAGIIAEKASFTLAFNTIHAGVIDYRPSTKVTGVDAASRSLTLSTETNPGVWVTSSLQGDVLNVIPNQRAGQIVQSSGLANVSDRWAGVDVLSYESSVAGASGIHIIGDSSATTQPKAGHIANAEAKVCADAIFRSLQGFNPDPSPVTNSACYSPITATTASWLTAVFAYDPVTKTMKIVPGASGEASGPSTKNYKEMSKWFGELMLDSFA